MCTPTWRSATLARYPELVPPRLERAYRLTRYRVTSVDIRIDRVPSAALFALLGARRAALVTAWNPRSRRMPDGWNRRMQRRLRLRLRRLEVIDAEGSLHRWHEPMLLVAGDARPVIVLARRFRQRAIVVLHSGCRARLRAL